MMRYEFLLSEGYSVEELRQLNRLYARKSRGRLAVDLVLRIIKLAVAGVLLWAGCFGGFGVVFRILLVLVGAAELCSAVLQSRIRARRGKRLLARQSQFVKVLLDENGITEQTAAGKNDADYSEVTELYERQGCWFLFLRDGRAILLPRRALQSGGADFGAFLEAQTGKTVNRK